MSEVITQTIRFVAYGRPQTQGSTRAFGYMKNGQPRGAVTHDQPEKVASWRAVVTDAALKAMGDDTMVGGAVSINMQFFIKRPDNQYSNAKGREHELKKSSPKYQTKKPDIDKLIRAVLDALSSVVYRDDSQVMTINAAKCFAGYNERERAEIQVCFLE